jgi:hypothetical protein
MVYVDQDASSSTAEVLSIYDSLTVLPRLQKITGSEILLEPQNLDLLGRLLHLEHLFIYSGFHERSPPNRSWPLGYFPQLRRMQIENMRPETISSLWSIAALVQSLTELEIRFLDYDPRVMSDSDQWATAFIRDLPIQSPNINSLALAFHGLCFKTVKLSFPEIQSFNQLPLQSINLNHVDFAEGVPHSNFILSVRQLKVLRLMSMTIQLSDLCFFAANLPNIQILSVFVNFDMVADSGISVVEAISHTPVAHKVILEDLDLSRAETHMHVVARLAHLFVSDVAYTHCLDSSDIFIGFGQACSVSSTTHGYRVFLATN